ncbi:universal stress protein [Streptomyces sp. NPDC002742]|jgi:nucleotide-binding universal stress UspA family protein|uniref:universal stress protein n=1 Tax=unclassified Streptomyces TaxID=2593676 RepID=UPI00341317FB
MAQRNVAGHVPGPERLRAVVLGIDARSPCDVVTGFAFEAALRRGALLHAVHAWGLPTPDRPSPPFAPPEEDRGAREDEEVQLLADALRPWREKYPQVRVYEDVRLQSPRTALVHASDSAGLLVLGRGGTALGPTLQAVLSRTMCPVTVVPH